MAQLLTQKLKPQNYRWSRGADDNFTAHVVVEGEDVLRAYSCWHVCRHRDVTSRNVRPLSTTTPPPPPKAINGHMRRAINVH